MVLVDSGALLQPLTIKTAIYVKNECFAPNLAIYEKMKKQFGCQT